MSRVKLFCFPYAGGSAAIYNSWKKYLNPAIEIIPVELAGRGRRIADEHYADVDELIEDVFHKVKDEIKYSSYALFGHSMGGMIAYELAQKIRENGLNEPEHVFFSGRSAPHIAREEKKKYHLMDDASFKKEVIGLGGTPPEFFDHPELMELFLPLLKNDFELSETQSIVEITPLNVDITAFFGMEEDLSSEQCDGWKMHTRARCSIHYFRGGHFFIHQETKDIIQIINQTITSDQQRLSIPTNGYGYERITE